MSVTSQAGSISWGMQANGEKGGAVSTWYRHKALAVGLGPVVGKEIAPPEIGGPNNPTGAYKTSSYYGGDLSLQPRLEGDFGWLLLAAMGQCVSEANGTTGYTHTFSQQNGNAMFLPFMGFRRIIPGRTLDKDLGEIGEDCIISQITFNLAPGGPLSVDLSVLGRDWHFDEAPDLWTWADTTEDYSSVPMAMKGTGIRLPNYKANPLPATNARVTINNNTTTPQDEMVIGSYVPEDYTTRQRVLTVEMTYKWNDPDLYRFVINGGDPAELGFKPCIDFSDFELRVESPCPIDPGVIDYPWALQFEAPKVDWRFEPVRLAGDDLLMMNVVGTAIEAPSTLPEDYAKIILENTQADYAIPTT